MKKFKRCGLPIPSVIGLPNFLSINSLILQFRHAEANAPRFRCSPVDFLSARAAFADRRRK
ncbi:MAG: hypothetical protein M3T96_01200 [Acidobacteriota bacterium]|nr:hypothetical protein [Acidobacteriota bacterium]